MFTMSKNMYSWVTFDESFKVIEITPELLRAFNDQSESITIKSPEPEDYPVLCTNNNSYQLRRNNHSNCMLVCHSTTQGLISFCGLNSQLEAKLVQGKILTQGLPIVHENGDWQVTSKKIPSVGSLARRSPISEGEFWHSWHDLKGCEIEGQAVILSDSLVSVILHNILGVIVRDRMGMKSLASIELYNTVDRLQFVTIEMIETVLLKFSQNYEEPCTLNERKISQWYGINVLRNIARYKSINVEEFLIAWKSEFPAFYEVEIDIEQLLGYFVRPSAGKIRYLDKSKLSSDAATRFQELFRLQSEWNLKEMTPYLKDVNNRNLKLENFVMKFAKRRKVGEQIIVTSR
ncbi:Subunit of a complex with Ctf8p and Ctf18p that shares some components with Replication Factor C [Komagataella phaffii GS115]|uniref:Subunit of a complex with Ctf8p and Ctf18p that shares some components with Replication Factor C n=2 Tax=Komagataella phaffii TaxID=460519 RepID=C4QX54_KOMPG|nr:Subunit of a complex with Ctf8p and Ctf18p that shares some components with Replication Factor C [Komagataella phaffii GS115]AOA60680.1 GQ67_02196T0 [Komagataella phaffii]AOA65893.1 GQ68_02211T0 [Komagataella phaffii GS115]CAY67827.1 Subunit of a complex with Ctf8p and Ctf18p that shares some components with Replication Factor C [Komagataella phaffii GS115]